jgi:hypothetical protein
VTVTDYDLEAIARLLNAIDPPLDGPRPFNVPRLKAIARAWMDDMHDYCNVSRTPSIGSDYLGGPLTLHDSMGLVFTRRSATA